MRFLASVNTLMDSQGRSLNEHLSAVRPVADVRSDAAVDTLCSSLAKVRYPRILMLTVSRKITSSSKSFSASATGICLNGLLRLRLLLLLRHMLHAHVRHAHVWHVRITGKLHSGGHGVGNVHRRVHRRR